MRTISEAVYAARNSSQLTQEALAQKSGVTHMTISNLETNRTHSPKLDTLQKIAFGLGMTVAELLEGVNEVYYE